MREGKKMSIQGNAFPAPKNFLQKIIFDPSSWSLLISNLITIFIAVSENWSIGLIMLAYWSQSVIIGFFNFFRIISLKNFSTENFRINNQPVRPSEQSKWRTARFFAIHYGAFHLGYLIFILTDFAKGIGFQELLFVIAAAAVFFANHLYSFIHNLAKDTAKKRNIGTVMFFPYARIIPMHLTIVTGGTLIASQTALIGFLALKTIADLIMHAIEHSWE